MCIVDHFIHWQIPFHFTITDRLIHSPITHTVMDSSFHTLHIDTEYITSFNSTNHVHATCKLMPRCYILWFWEEKKEKYNVTKTIMIKRSNSKLAYSRNNYIVTHMYASLVTLKMCYLAPADLGHPFAQQVEAQTHEHAAGEEQSHCVWREEVHEWVTPPAGRDVKIHDPHVVG